MNTNLFTQDIFFCDHCGGIESRKALKMLNGIGYFCPLCLHQEQGDLLLISTQVMPANSHFEVDLQAAYDEMNGLYIYRKHIHALKQVFDAETEAYHVETETYTLAETPTGYLIQVGSTITLRLITYSHLSLALSQGEGTRAYAQQTNSDKGACSLAESNQATL